MKLSVFHNKLKKGEINIADYIKKTVDEAERINKELNCFVDIFRTESLEKAEAVNKKIQNKEELLPLEGMTIAVKNNISIKGKRLTCSSKLLESMISPYDAYAVKKLKEAGAIIIGTTNLDEFAMGSSNENSYLGKVKNPFDIERVPGGSSGGSAAAAASNIVMAALGSDTGGSVRQPASFTGIYGLKPTYGRISRYGLVAFASSLDQIGIFSRFIENSAAVLKTISGRDEMDSTSSDIPVDDYPIEMKTKKDKYIVGLPKEYFSFSMDEEISDSVNSLKEKLIKTGKIEFKEIEMPYSKFGIPVYYILATAEASSNLARYDGVRYTYRSGKYEDLDSLYSITRTEGFGEEVKRRIMLGTFVLSSGYYDAYYLKAQKFRTLIKNDFDRAFNETDIVLMPTTPFLPFKIGEKIDDPISMYLSDIFTVNVNIAGVAGINIPIGLSKKGLPLSVQAVSKEFEESKLLNFVNWLEENKLAESPLPRIHADLEGEN